MGKNKLAKFEEMKGFEHVIQAPYSSVKDSDFKLKGRWRDSFFRNDNPVVLELGCGKGEYTVELAEKFPGINYIGVDIKGARLWQGAKIALSRELKNVAFLRTNIEIINQFFAPDEVDEIWLTFPDPQMKKTGKRLTSANFLNKYKCFLKAGGVIHLKTDSEFLFAYTCALVHLNKFDVLYETGNLYESGINNETLHIKTFYEKQWLSRGISIKYISFRLNEKSYIEPEIEIARDKYRSFGRDAR